MTPPRAIIFDCDGTLVDSETPGLDVLHEEASRFGVALSRDEAHRLFRGKRMAWSVSEIAGRLPSVTEDFEAGFTARVREAMAARFRRDLVSMPGANDLLSRLRVPFCVATNGPREKVELTLGLTGLRRHFADELIFTAYEVGHWKPAPGLFLHAAQVMGVPAADCAVVEDSIPGIEAGVAAGMHVFSLHGPGLPAHLQSEVREIDSLRVLNGMLHGGSAP